MLFFYHNALWSLPYQTDWRVPCWLIRIPWARVERPLPRPTASHGRNPVLRYFRWADLFRHQHLWWQRMGVMARKPHDSAYDTGHCKWQYNLEKILWLCLHRGQEPPQSSQFLFRHWVVYRQQHEWQKVIDYAKHETAPEVFMMLKPAVRSGEYRADDTVLDKSCFHMSIRSIKSIHIGSMKTNTHKALVFNL